MKESFKKEIKDINDKMNNLMYNLDNYFDIYKYKINSYGNKKEIIFY